MTIREATQLIIKQLRSISPNTSTEVPLILEHVLDCSKSQLIQLDSNTELTESELSRLNKILRRRLNHEPIELILGSTEFYGYQIKVQPGILIPRPETEQLVELVLTSIEETTNQVSILEVGVGSGCISVALIAEILKQGNAVEYIGIDIDASAVDLTNQNIDSLFEEYPALQSQKHIISIEQATLPEYLKNHQPATKILVSNPPYLTESEIEELDRSVANFEPLTALAGGPDGLNVYQEIISTLPGIKPDKAFFEASPSTVVELANLLKTYYKSIRIIEDLYGRDRFVVADDYSPSNSNALVT